MNGIIKVKHLNESFSVVSTKPESIKKEIAKLFKAHPDGYQFNPKYRMGMWDGYVNFFKVKDKYLVIPRGLVKYIKEFADGYYHFEILNEPEKINPKKDVLQFIEEMKLPYELRDYQLKTILRAIYEKRGTYILATGSGKSLIQAIIAMYLAKDGDKSVIIVPNVSLVHQFYSDMEDYFQNAPFKVEDRVHKIYAGQPKHFEYPVTISTWQSLQKSPELFADVKCLIIDEVQKAKNFETVISEMIIPSTINSEYKFGFTGSMPKGRLAELSIVGGLGPVNKIVTAKDLIDMGFGTPMEINLLYLKYSEFMAREIRKYSYQSEKKLFRLLPERNEIIVKLAKNLTQKYGNTLILFETIAHGYDLVKELIDGVFLTKITRKTIKEMIDNLPEKILVNTYSEKEKRIVKKLEEEHNVKINIETLEDNHIFFIYGEIDSKIREEIRHKVEKLEDAIIIANYQTFSTGINIKNLHNLIFASSIKSFETIVQSLGRTIRLKEGKDKVRIFDIIDDCVKGRSKNYGYKHFEERLQIYFDEGHRLKEKRVHMNISYEKFKEYEKEFEIIKK